MNRFVSASRAAALAAAVVSLCFGTASANPPVEAFGSLPQFDNWRLSPDAKHIAVIQPRDGVPVVLIYAVGAPAGTKPASFGTTDGVARDLQWVSNDRLVVYFSANFSVLFSSVTREWNLIEAMDTQAQNLERIDSPILGVDLSDPEHAFV